MRIVYSIIALIALTTTAMAQQPVKYDWQTAVGGVPSVIIVPTSPTAVVTVTAPRYVRVDQITLHNTSASSATVSITDQTTNCNSAACAVVASPLTIAAHSTYIMSLQGQPAGAGVVWTSSTANAIQGWMAGRYDVQR